MTLHRARNVVAKGKAQRTSATELHLDTPSEGISAPSSGSEEETSTQQVKRKKWQKKVLEASDDERGTAKGPKNQEASVATPGMSLTLM